MLGKPFTHLHTRIAAVYLGLLLPHLVGGVKILSKPGELVDLPCTYHYEDKNNIPQLSVQWRGPVNGLLCHYIKHKAFQNCSAGYSMTYTPGRITLTIQEVKMEDFGSHICSVSKRHEFSDFSVELAMLTETSVTSAPTSNWDQSGLSKAHIPILAFSVFICIWG